MTSDHFRPIRPGKGANTSEKIPPRGRMLPIQENWSGVGTKSRGEYDKSPDIFSIHGLDQPIAVPHDIPIIFAMGDRS